MSEMEDRLLALRLEVLEAEVSRQKAPPKKESFWKNPLLLAIIGATATAFLGLITNQAQLKASRQLERDKLESSLVIKAVEAEDPNERVKALQFLVKAGLISDPKGKIIDLQAEEVPRIQDGRTESIQDKVSLAPIPLVKSVSLSALIPDNYKPSSNLLASILADPKVQKGLGARAIALLKENSVFELNREGIYLQILVLRLPGNDVPYKDALLILRKSKDGVYEVSIIAATARPFGHYLAKPVNPAGAAQIRPGHYRYSLGLHRGRYPSLIQKGAVYIDRLDANSNAVLSDAGLFGLNFAKDRGKASAATGMILIRDTATASDFAAFMELVSIAAKKGQTIFPTTVIDLNHEYSDRTSNSL